MGESSTVATWGDGRYRLVGELGRGAMGVVHRAIDTQSNTEVALKTVTSLSPTVIYRLKQEFRALTDLVHPNLVNFYELGFAEPNWFFTMEILSGQDFRRHVIDAGGLGSLSRSLSLTDGAGPTQAASAGSVSQEELTETGDAIDVAQPVGTSSVGPEIEAILSGRAPRRPMQADLAKLTPALSQLVLGVHALHNYGLLHRDLKPSNVMVEPDGRVVLLDFGVITDVASVDSSLAGTLPYMAPETFRGEPPSRANDWYAVGVMLYEVITGVRPASFATGQSAHAIANVGLPPSPSRICSNVPESLETLCMGLLDPSPRRRWSYTQAAAVLNLASDTSSGVMRVSAQDMPLVGREAELETLQSILGDAREDGVGLTLVSGQSGFGKTALVHHFLKQAEADGATVLRGRCFEQETVPYKAIDSLMDALVSHLLRMDVDDVRAILPSDVSRVARLFPGFRRVRVIDEAKVIDDGRLEAQALRRRAFRSLTRLLGNLAESGPLVLFIDDIQWGDLDSLPFIRELTRVGSTARVMLIASYRSEDQDNSPLLRALMAKDENHEYRPTEYIEVHPLSERQSCALIDAASGGYALPDAIVEGLVTESRGNPYFLVELIQYSLERGTDSGAAVTLDEVMSARLKRLTSDAQSLLDMVAMARRPRNARLLFKAAELTGDGQKALNALRVARMVSVTRREEEELVECYNARVQQSLSAVMEPVFVRQRSRRLAEVLESESSTDAEDLSELFFTAGQTQKAATYAELAADEAAEALAFEHAVGLYRRALEFGEDEAERRSALKERLAQTLANAGRSREAADAYGELAQGAEGDQRIEWLRTCGYYYLSSGHIDEGLEAMSQVLSAVGMKLPPSPSRAILSLGLNRLKLSLRGFKFKQAQTLDQRQLQRAETCVRMALSFGMVDLFRGADFVTRAVLESLKLGDAERVGIGLGLEAGFLAAGGGVKKKAAAFSILDRAQLIAEETGSEYLTHHLANARSMVYYQVSNRFDLALKYSDEAIAHLEGRAGHAFESSTGQLYSMWALYYLGEFGTLQERVLRLTEEAEARGDNYARTSAHTGLPAAAYLAQDRGEECIALSEAVLSGWTSKHGLQMQHYWATFSLVQALLYEGRGLEAYERIIEAWPQFKRAMILGMDVVHSEASHLRGRAALIAASQTTDEAARRAMLKDAHRNARLLKKKPLDWMKSLGMLLEGGLLAARGELTAARHTLETAASHLEASHMKLFALAARHARQRLEPGQSGDALAALEDGIRACGVSEPTKIAKFLSPAPTPHHRLAQ